MDKNFDQKVTLCYEKSDKIYDWPIFRRSYEGLESQTVRTFLD